MHVSHSTKCRQVQEKLEAEWMERPLDEYKDSKPHPAEGSKGSDLPSVNDSQFDHDQDNSDMNFLIIASWDRVSKQNFLRTRKIRITY